MEGKGKIDMTWMGYHMILKHLVMTHGTLLPHGNPSVIPHQHPATLTKFEKNIWSSKIVLAIIGGVYI